MDQSLLIYDQIVKCNGTEKAVAQIAAIVLYGRYIYSRKTHKWYYWHESEWKEDHAVAVSMRSDLARIVANQFNTVAKRYLQAIMNTREKQSDKALSTIHGTIEKMDKIRHKLGMKTFADRVIREMRTSLTEQSI